jgi:hypothetical protein
LLDCLSFASLLLFVVFYVQTGKDHAGVVKARGTAFADLDLAYFLFVLPDPGRAVFGA